MSIVSAIKKWAIENKKKVLSIFAVLAVVVVAVTVIILTLFFVNRDRNKSLIWKGDKSNIVKTKERKQRLVIGTLDSISTSKTYFREDGATSLINALVYEPLMRINEDLTIENVLAKSIKFSSDGLVAEIVLNDAMFSDGSALKAEHVKAAYLEILKNCEDGIYIERCSNIKGVEDYISGVAEDVEGIIVEEERELTIAFEDVAAWNMEAFTLPVFKNVEAEGEKALGTGSYKIEGYQYNESIQLTENSMSKSAGLDYRQIDIKRISTLGISEDIANYEIDVFILPYRDDLEEIKEAGYHNIYRLPDTKNLNYFLMNLDDEAGSNISVRKAISKSMDRERLSEEFDDGQVINNGYLTATSDKVEILSRDVNKAKGLLKKVAEPKVFYYGEIDIISQIRFNGVRESLKEAGIMVETGNKGDYTITYVRSIAGMVLKDIEESILNTQKKEEYCEKIKSVYKKNNDTWMRQIEEYYKDECLIVPYSSNTYHLVISSDVDTKAIREFVANNY